MFKVTERELELRIMEELSTIRVEMQKLTSSLEKSELIFNALIEEHRKECYKCSEFVKAAELENEINKIIEKKQQKESEAKDKAKKSFITTAEVIKNAIYLITLISSILYIKG